MLAGAQPLEDHHLGRHHVGAHPARPLGRGEPVSASEYTFRTQLSIETSDAELAWLNDGVFIAVGGREPTGVVYEVYLVA